MMPGYESVFQITLVHKEMANAYNLSKFVSIAARLQNLYFIEVSHIKLKICQNTETPVIQSYS